MTGQLVDPLNFVALIILTPLALLIGRWVLKPILKRDEKYCRNRKERSRWRRLDVLILLLQIVFVGAFTYSTDPEFFEADIEGLLYLWGVAFLSWWMIQGGLKRREIIDPWRRTIALAVLGPATFLWPPLICFCHPLFLLILGPLALISLHWEPRQNFGLTCKPLLT